MKKRKTAAEYSLLGRHTGQAKLPSDTEYHIVVLELSMAAEIGEAFSNPPNAH